MSKRPLRHRRESLLRLRPRRSPAAELPPQQNVRVSSAPLSSPVRESDLPTGGLRLPGQSSYDYDSDCQCSVTVSVLRCTAHSFVVERVWSDALVSKQAAEHSDMTIGLAAAKQIA